MTNEFRQELEKQKDVESKEKLLETLRSRKSTIKAKR